ncbi:MAG: alkaline phosphatase family protein [Gemmatimonadota bacterium]
MVINQELPALVVVLVASGMRYDYLSRFRHRFGPSGLNRLLEGGAVFSNTRYTFARAHHFQSSATIATGTTPSRHGVSAVSWIEPDTGRRRHVLADEDYPLVGGVSDGVPLVGHAGASPLSLLGSTLGDELKLAMGNAPKVHAVQGIGLLGGVGDAVLFGGRTADGAFGLDRSNGNFVSSRYYYDALPRWADEFNRRREVDRWYGGQWRVADDVAVDLAPAPDGPDPEYYGRLARTPYADEITMDFALDLVRHEGLGADATPDLLYIYLFAADRSGHTWGPYSAEIEEIIVGTDRQVARLLDFLDEVVGRDRYWVVLTSDHGMSPSFEQAERAGLHPKRSDWRDIPVVMDRALTERWGEGDWLLEWGDFNYATLRQKGVSLAEVVEVAGDAALTLGVFIGYHGPHFSRTDPVTARAYELAYFPGRSGDLYMITAPFVAGPGQGAGHGTIYSYDTHVPLIFYGAPFHARVFRGEAAPTDIAPTLSSLLGISPPAQADGRVLYEAVRERGRP